MKSHKAFVRDDDTIVIKCPYCRNSRIISVRETKVRKKVLKIRCACQEFFSVFLEFRKLYRKSTNLSGRYANLSQKTGNAMMIVRDISMGGIGFQTVGKSRLAKDHEIEVSFTLDDNYSSAIRKLVKVKTVRDRFVGCEYVPDPEYDRALGQYLIS